MAKDNATTPNQRLLELIRKPSGARAGAAASDRAVAARPGFFSLGKTVSVGVDISQTQLTCVKIRGRDAGFEVLGAVVAPVPEGVEPGSEAFVALLRRTLSELCGGALLPRLWAAVQSSRANLQFVTIPKVSSGQVNNAVFWTAKKEMGFDEANVVFDFERRGEVVEKGATKIGAFAYTAPRDAVEAVRGDFVKAGFPLAGLTLEPFAHQNYFRRRIVPDSPGATANLHVGQNWSRLEIFSNGNLMFVRVIKTSMSGMELAVQEALEANLAVTPQPIAEQGLSLAEPAPEEPLFDLDDAGPAGSDLVLELDTEAPLPPPVAAPAAATRAAVTLEQARELFWSIIYGCEHLDDAHPGCGLGPGEVMGMLEPVAARLVRQVEMTLKHYRESLGYAAVTHLTVSGLLGGSQIFVSYIGEQAGLPCAPLDPLGPRAPKALGPCGWDLPGSAWSQALGLAFSDTAATPSAFFTYREKATVRISRLLEQWSLVALAVVLAAMTFFSFDAASTRRALTRERDQLTRQSAMLGGSADVAVLSRMTMELRAKRESLRAFAARNSVVGIWGQVLALAPEGVGIGTLTTELGPPAEPARPGQPAVKPGQPAKPAQMAGRLVLEGVITGDPRLFDSMLASYVVALEGSPFFGDVSVKKSELEALDGGATGLHFVIGLGLSQE